MLVEGLEGADEDAAVLQDAPHAEVDVLQHLAALAHSLGKEGEKKTIKFSPAIMFATHQYGRSRKLFQGSTRTFTLKAMV